MKEYLKELKEELKNRDTVYMLICIVSFCLFHTLALVMAAFLLALYMKAFWLILTAVFILEMIATILFVRA